MKRESDYDFLIVQYQMIVQKSISHNSIMWEMPSLIFLAESVLWNISLSKDIDTSIRIVVSLFSVVIGLATLQTYERLRIIQISYSEQLRSIEVEMKKYGYISIVLSNVLEKRERIINHKPKSIVRFLKKHPLYNRNRLGKMRTYSIWHYSFLLTILFSAFISAWLIISAVIQK